MDFKDRYRQLWSQYEGAYDLTTLNDANDKSNLEMIIRNAALIELLQEKITEMAEEDAAGNITEIKKISDSVRDLTDRNIQLERQLGIDRKSRKKDSEATTGEYILMLKAAAAEFLERRLIKVYCPDCKVMVGRLSPVHEHTAFNAYFQCSQCQRPVIAGRAERDVFFDIAKDDKEWRRKYPVQIKQPKRSKSGRGSDDAVAEAELIIEDDEVEDGD
jgi:hypothetical protein